MLLTIRFFCSSFLKTPKKDESKTEPRKKKLARREPSQKEIKVHEVETSLHPEESLGVKGLFLPQGFVLVDVFFPKKKDRG